MFPVYLLAGQVLDGDFIKPDSLCNFSLNLLCTGIIFRRWGRFLVLSAPTGLFVLIGDGTDDMAGIADSHRVVRNIFNNNTAAANHNIASDRNPRHDMNARSDPNIAAHRDGIRIFQSLVAPLGINGVLPCRSRSSVQ